MSGAPHSQLNLLNQNKEKGEKDEDCTALPKTHTSSKNDTLWAMTKVL